MKEEITVVFPQTHLEEQLTNDKKIEVEFPEEVEKMMEENEIEVIFPQEEVLNQKLSSQTKTQKSRSVLKTKKFLLHPSESEKKILTEWFGIFRWFYNQARDYCEEHKEYNFRKVREGLKNGSRFYTLPDWWKNTTVEVSSRIISGAIMDCCKAYKTAFALKKAGIIKYFNMKPKTKKNPNQTLFLEKSCIHNGKILPTFGLGNIKSVYKQKKKVYQLKDIKVKKDCRISYKDGKFWLLVPVDSPCCESQTTRKKIGKVIALDTGIRTFQTGFDPSGTTVHLGINPVDKFLPLLKKVDVLKSKRDTVESFTNKKTKSQRNAKILKYNKKIRDLATDMHWKMSKFLVTNYETIVLSDFSPSEVLKNRKLYKQSKRILQCLSFYLFKERLKFKCEEYGSKLVLQNEAYTSKTCTKCGTLNNKLKSSKIFNCTNSKCNLSIDRDENASRNIYLRYTTNS